MTTTCPVSHYIHQTHVPTRRAERDRLAVQFGVGAPVPAVRVASHPHLWSIAASARVVHARGLGMMLAHTAGSPMIRRAPAP